MGMPSMISVYLMETDEGPVLFESGPHSCLPYLEKGLKEFGYKKEDIKHLFLTHIHLDHAGGAWEFAKQGAKIYVHPIGIKHLIDPSRLVASATKIYKNQMDTLWGKFLPIPEENLISLDHEQVIVIGGKKIKALYSPGHADHHLAYSTSEGIVCGDVAGIRIEAGPPVPPCPPPDIKLDAWRESIDILMKENPETLHVAHFGTHQNGVQHLKDLKAEIELIDEFSYNLYKKTPNPKEALSEFDGWIKNRINQITPNETIANYYAISNPTWMNINGIFRYYYKKENA